MDKVLRAGGSALRVAPLFGLMLAAGCIADAPSGVQTTGATSTVSAQPRSATYSCGEDGQITVENMRTSVVVTGPDGAGVQLPASPPQQSARFGVEGQALVLEGREALYMVSGRVPMTCMR